MKRFLLFPVLLLIAQVGVFAQDAATETRPSIEPDFLFAKNIAPRDRINLGFINRELHNHDIYERKQTLYLGGEYAFLESLSMVAELPYSKVWKTETDPRQHLDQALLGLHSGFRLGDWMPALGLDIRFPTGNEETGIGSKTVGSLEPYLGLRFNYDYLYLAGIVRYEAETNKEFKEQEDQQFERTWRAEVVLALSLSYVDLLLEYRYRYTNDPEENRFSMHAIAPGLWIKPWDEFKVGISIPYALSIEREYDLGFEVRATYLY